MELILLGEHFSYDTGSVLFGSTSWWECSESPAMTASFP